jgi:hypothetical protein
MRIPSVTRADEETKPSELGALSGSPGVVRGFLVVLALAAAGCVAPAESSDSEPADQHEDSVESGERVRLPIEVLGRQGTRQTVEVQVDDPTNVTHLLLRCNACGYHNSDLDGDASKVKATVSINGGSPINIKRYTAGGGDVGNRNIEVLDAARDYGGIGGVYRTVRMKIPVSGIRRGTNTITFEHKTAAAPSIGFRILSLKLLRNGRSSILPDSSFVRDDPASWRPPRSGADDIARGRELWNRRNHLDDPGVDAINGDRGPGIVASCADCHASDGRDLKYFNFSNRSIVERSIFHGLERVDGERIASYIRSLPLATVAAARPWNPTYQPGPGMDGRPVYEWAAGAGVDAILGRDADMKNYLFPGDSSISKDDVRAVASRFGKLNMRELPVSLPMPEWNQWLPLIHPDDAFDTSASAIRQDHEGRSISQPYYTELYKQAQRSSTPENIGRMTQHVKTWLRRGMTCDTNGSGNGEPWRGLNGGVLNAIRLPKKTYRTCEDKDSRRRSDEVAYEIAKRGLADWIAVKQWEIVHGKNLENEGTKEQTARVPYVGGHRTLNSKNVCAGRCVDARERGWFVFGRNVFDRPPHFTSHDSRHFYGQDRLVGIAETNSWYHLNMILNPGYRVMMPNHFAYVCSHIEFLQDESDVDQGFRFWASMIKQRQLQTNGLYGAETGLDLRTAQPHVYYKANRSGNSRTQASVGQPLWRYFAQAMVEDFVADADRATAEQWAAASGNSEVQDRNSTDFSNGDRFDTGAVQGRNTRRVIPKLLEIGVERSAVVKLNDWAKKTWPRGPWDSLL